MTSASQATSPVTLPLPEQVGESHARHALRAGTTATLIHDCRELFKVRVTGMVLVTGWAGFYLGSMQSGISTLQRGLIDTLLGDRKSVV